MHMVNFMFAHLRQYFIEVVSLRVWVQFTFSFKIQWLGLVRNEPPLFIWVVLHCWLGLPIASLTAKSWRVSQLFLSGTRWPIDNWGSKVDRAAFCGLGHSSWPLQKCGNRGLTDSLISQKIRCVSHIIVVEAGVAHRCLWETSVSLG